MGQGYATWNGSSVKLTNLRLFPLIICLAACSERTVMAPVVELKWQPPQSHPRTHIVKSGETLYAVAFRYDQDYRQLAVINHLHAPYALRVGQVIQLRGGGQLQPHYEPLQQTNRTIRRPRPQTPSYAPREYYGNNSGWVWPVRGRVATKFLPQEGKKGIDIAGVKGDKIHAASGGIVAYAGNGLSGYGNLIIIKHNNQFLTAYGNNLRNVVKEGQKVKAGQVIAEMGIIDRTFYGVHFEIRKAGRPVNPLAYLH